MKLIPYHTDGLIVETSTGMKFIITDTPNHGIVLESFDQKTWLEISGVPYDEGAITPSKKLGAFRSLMIQ